MKNIVLRRLFVISLFLSACLHCGAGDARIAVISMERVFDTHHRTQEANALLKERFAELENERKQLLSEVKKLRSEAETLIQEAADSSLSKSEQERKRTLARKKQERFADAEEKLIRFDTLSKSELGDRLRDTQQEIVEDIRNVIQQYVKDRNIAVVLDNSGKTMNAVEAVIYFDRALDITDDIIALLRKKKSPDGGSDQ